MSGSEIAAEVSAGLAEAGAETGNGAPLIGTLTRPVALGADPWTAGPGGSPQTWDVTVVKTKFQIRHIDGELIRATDDRLLVEATGPEPMLSDTLMVGSITYTIMNVWPIAPGDVPVLYIVQGRA